MCLCPPLTFAAFTAGEMFCARRIQNSARAFHRSYRECKRMKAQQRIEGSEHASQRLVRQRDANMACRMKAAAANATTNGMRRVQSYDAAIDLHRCQWIFIVCNCCCTVLLWLS